MSHGSKLLSSKYARLPAALVIVLTVLALLLGGGCGPSTSGESHFGTTKAFLRVCEDGVCGSGDSCECAVCTVSCKKVADCALRILGPDGKASDLPDNVVCRVPLCASAEESAEAGDAVCDVTCSDDADCAFLDKDGGAHQCVDGLCRTLDDPEDPVEPPPTFSSCPEGRTLVPGERTASGFGYCLDTTEVTVGAYRTCVDAGVCTAPTSGNFLTSGREEHPIHMVTLADAEAYCGQAGGRVPTFEEWSSAVVVAADLGSDTYPWGSVSPAASDVPPRVCALGISDTCPAGSYPDGAGPSGHLDLSGNVAELVLTGAGSCVAGGSYDSAAAELSVSSCPETAPPDLTIGFRCASSL